ncbi:hypothetical protein RMATCC62417_13445 [Rhizopus microsporus]|nr:hypothetical protein RMATCC62417_13445 [Rhizopus microsporus]
MLLSLNVVLNQGSFNVRKHPHEKPIDLLSLVFDNFVLGFTKYVESFTATAALGDMNLYDKQRPESPYYKLMGAKDKDTSHRKSVTLDNQLKNITGVVKDPFFTATFEYKPLDNRADNAAALYMRNIDIVYNPEIIRELVVFFTPPETSADSINALIEVAGDTFEGIKKQTRASLEYALEQHTTFDLKVDMDAPVIIIPENCTSTSCRAIVIDAGHINVESNLSSPETRTQMKSKSGPEMSAEDNLRFRSLMYDRFTIQLTETKVLVGDSLDTCLVQIRNPRPELSYLHLIDHIDMTFLLELCIIRKSVDMPRFKVSGHLPLLKVNFSDTKYKALMQLPQLIEASGILGDRANSPIDETSVNNQVDQHLFRLMNIPLWSNPDDDMLLESDSESSDIYTDSVSDTVNTQTTNATSTHSVKPKQDAVNIEERLFELDFKVDQVLANILETQKVEKTQETLLCEVDLKSLKLNYSMRPMDMSVHVSLKSLDVTDKMKHGNEFKYLVTSDQSILQSGLSGESELKELVNIEYVQCSKQSPEYLTKHKGIDQTIYATLSTLNFIVTRSSVLTLHNFIMHTFVDNEDMKNSNQQATKSPNIRRTSSTPYPAILSLDQSNKDNNNVYVRLLLDSVNFVLNNDGQRLATGELSLGDLTTIISDGQVNVAAKFANFTLTDDVSPAKALGSRNMANQLLTIQGEELIDLKYTSFVNDGRKDYPGYDHAVYLRMGSAQFNFLEAPVYQLMQFLSKFAEMKSTYDIARQAALESAQQLSEAATKTHFDIVIKTPVVLFPEFHQGSSDLVVAHLGEIWASNTFVNENGRSINSIKAGLRAISLTSKFYFRRSNNQMQLQTLPIVDDIDINFVIQVSQQGQLDSSSVDIQGSISDISMKVTERQYIFLMEAINMLPRIFSSPEGGSKQSTSSLANTAMSGNLSQRYAEAVSENSGNYASPEITMAIHANMIKLEVYMGEGADIQSPTSLACFALHNSKVDLHMDSDSSMDILVVVPSLTVDDTRPGIKSEYKNIVPVIENGNQFELQLDLKPPTPSRTGVMMMTIRDSKVLDVTDKMKHGNEFKYLVTSDQSILQSGLSGESELKELVNIEYVQCSKQSPEYLTKHKGIDQTIYATLSTLNFIVTRSSVLTLHNFIMHTFVDNEDMKNSNQQATKSPNIRRTSSTPYPAILSLDQSNKDNNNVYVRLLLDSVNFVLNNDGQRLATGELSLGDLTTIISDGQVNVAAKFANFTLTDDVSPAKALGSRNMANQLLTIQGEELIDLKYTSFVNDGRKDYPGYDHAVYLRMGSAQFNFLEAPVYQLMQFLSKFAEMKSTYDIARQAALESAQQLSEAATKTHFDIVIKTPVVLFPEFHQGSSDLVVAHLGEIWASNTFVNENGRSINSIKAGLRAISLTSKFYFRRSNNQMQLQTLPIVDDIDINFVIQVSQQGQLDSSSVDIQGSISDISMKVTERQYIFLMEAINMLPRIFSSPEGGSKQSTSSLANTAMSGNLSQRYAEAVSENSGNYASPEITMAIHANMIKLEVYMGEGADIQSPTSLACFALHNSKVDLHMDSDSSMDILVVVPSLTVDDTRPGIKSEYKNIVPVIENGNQFELQLDLKPPTPSRTGVMMMTIRDSKVILSLDHVFSLLNFFMLPFNDKNQLWSERERPEDDIQSSNIDLSYIVKVLNAEFVLLANPEKLDSEAIVLSTEELMVTQQAKTALVVKQMGMFLCRMDMRQNSTLRFIQPFDVNLSMNSNPRNEKGGLLTDIVMNIDPLIMRVSYCDVMLITDIVNNAFDLYTASIGGDKQMTKTEYAQGLLSPSLVNSQKDADSVNAIALAQESLRISFQGAQVILIEELHETPMVIMSLKPFNLEVSNWSKELAASVQLYAHINYFNIKNSHWEPLVEPWNFKLELSRNPAVGNDVTHVKIISNNTLNLNITHTFLESTVSIAQMLDKQRDTVYSGERGTVAPYEIRNRTGYDITIWNSTNSNEGPTLKELKDGDSIPWWFEDWRKRRETTEVTSNNLNVQIDGAQWRSLRDIQLDTEGEHMHALEPRLDNVQHHIVFDVKLANNIKVVTIRSSFVVENRTLLPVDLVSINPDGKTSSRIVKITPGEDYAIPIEQAYSHRFCIRPDEGFGYHWAQRAFHWRDFATPIKPPNALSCLSGNREMPPFIFHVDARLDKKNILYGQYPAMAIKLSAPIEIENLLPYDFSFRIIDKTSGQDFSSFLRKGGVMPIHVIENGHLVLLSIEMPDTDYRKSDYAIISTKRTDDLDVDRSIELVHKNDKNNKLHIRINTMDVPGSGGAKRYSIFSPYIIMNKTWLPISFKEKHTWSDAFMSNSDNVVTCKPGPKPEPFMFSYPNLDNRNRTLIKVDKSDWSQPLSFEAVGSVYDVVLPNTNRSEEIHVGIHVQEGQGRFKLTKTITITPRFVLSNQMNQNIRYRVPETKDEYTLEAGQRIPLYNIRVQNEKQLSIKLEGFSNAWSAPFNIQDIGDVHVRLSNDYGEPDALIRVSVLLQDATIFIVLTKEENWPYLLVNKTDEDMIFYQEDPILLRDDSTPVRNLRIKRYRLPAKQTVPYSWDLPAYKDKKMILSINGRERSINPQEIGTLPPFRHATRSGNPSITSIDIKIQGGRRVVELTPYRQSESQFKPVSGSLSRSSSMSSVDSAAREGFEVVDVDMKVNAVFQLQLREVDNCRSLPILPLEALT